MTVGQRVSYDGQLCTVRYVGPVAGTASTWLGVEWDDATRGKHDGTHHGVRYFTCLRGQRCAGSDRTAASFVRPTRRADTPQSFVAAVRQKYAEATDDDAPPVVISGKVAEAVGFDKVRRQLAQLGALRVVLVDGQRVATAREAGDAPIGDVCPQIRELDISRSLFSSLHVVADICRGLPHLHSLRVNGNRFTMDDIDDIDAFNAFSGITDLGLGETLLTWPELVRVASLFPALTTLAAGTNQLACTPLLPSLPSLSSTLTTLTTLNLEYNDFAALSDLAGVAQLPALRNLHLKGCAIARVAADGAVAPVFAPSLRFVDLSSNQIASWAFVDALPDTFPGLDALRLSHNPIYDNPYLDAGTSTSGTSGTLAGGPGTSDEAYMLAVGRVAQLRALNYSAVSPQDRANAEMFYLSRIARQLAGTDAGSAAEAAVLARHRRFDELCDLYGAPAIARHVAVDPAFLEARLVAADFVLGTTTRALSVPRSLSLYSVKSLVARLFGHAPQRLRLVCETGEWDPVGGAGDDDDDDDNDLDIASQEAVAVSHPADPGARPTLADDPHRAGATNPAPAPNSATDPATDSANDKTGTDETAADHDTGRWVKREVELRDAPRQFGFYVDGPAARIRVELV